MFKKFLLATAVTGTLFLGACSMFQNLIPNGTQTPAQQVATLQNDFAAAVAVASVVEANTAIPTATVQKIAAAEKTVTDALAAAEADLSNKGTNVTAAIAAVQVALTDLKNVLTTTGVSTQAATMGVHLK